MFPFSTDTVTLFLNVSWVGAYANPALLKMDVLIKSGSIHFKNSLIVTDTQCEMSNCVQLYFSTSM